MRVWMLVIGWAIASPAVAETPAPLGLDDGYGDAFVHYLPYIRTPKTPTKEPQKPPAPAAPTKKDDLEPVTVEWLRKHYPQLEERAINNPTQENVTAYLYVRRVILDKSQRFSEMVTQVTNQDALLNENNRIPYASGGALAVQNANYLAQRQAARELAAIGGLVVFVDGTCRFCAKQLPIVATLKHDVGMESLVISLDGSRPAGYKGPLQTDNGLFKKLGLLLTPSIVFIPHPKGYNGSADPNRYLIVAQGFYAQDDLVKQIAFAGHSSKLLTPATMADLDVWTHGVASNADLTSLRLSPTHPENYKAILQPLLLKQY